MSDPGAAALRLAKDGSDWRIGGPAEVVWIEQGTRVTREIDSAIPAVFDAYATLVVPDKHDGRDQNDAALLGLLRRHSAPQLWWLGYLETGGDPVVFSDAPRVRLYSNWPYVLVEAGPEQAAGWRSNHDLHCWRGAMPDLIFPTDRSWLVSTLWDDDWRCVGGARALVEALIATPVLQGRSVPLGEDATPPGHQSF